MQTKNEFKHFLIYQLPAIALALLIFILSSIPDFSAPDLELKFQDKWAHLIAYTIFGFLLSRAFYYQERFPGWKKNYIIIAIALGILYGLSDEYHQLHVPGRTGEALDFLADALGVIIGVYIFRHHAVAQRVSSPAR